MHGTCIKIAEAQQARIYNNYKNTNVKLKTNAAIWYNKIYKTKQLTPKYITSKSMKTTCKARILN